MFVRWEIGRREAVKRRRREEKEGVDVKEVKSSKVSSL